MAGGPLFPNSAYPVTEHVFENVHVGGGANSKHDVGLGVATAAVLDADATWRLRFQMPPSLPTGTCYLHLMSLADAEAGVLKVNPKWVSVDAEEDASSAALNAEGVTTITWAGADDDVYKETKIELNADNVTAGEVLVMDLVFEDTDMTLAVVSTHHVSLLWE